MQYIQFYFPFYNAFYLTEIKIYCKRAQKWIYTTGFIATKPRKPISDTIKKIMQFTNLEYSNTDVVLSNLSNMWYFSRLNIYPIVMAM